LASALASILFALAGAVYFFSYLLQRHAKTSAKHSSYGMPVLLPNWARAGLGFLLAIYFLFTLAIPYGSMVVTSLLKLISAGPTFENLTLGHYLQALTVESSGLRDALVASFALAVMAAALGSFVGAACARKNVVLAGVALIPAATPAITMAVGFIHAWNAPWTAWLPLYGSAGIVGLFYTVQCLPYAVQYARAGLATIPPSYEWAARVHGAGIAMTTRRIIAPLLWPHCLAGAILIFSISFRELIGSVLLRPPGMQTVSTFILREFDQGSPATGMAMGVIAIFVSLLSICFSPPSRAEDLVTGGEFKQICRKVDLRIQRPLVSFCESRPPYRNCSSQALSADLQVGPNPDMVRRPQVRIIWRRGVKAKSRSPHLDRSRYPDVIDTPVESLPLRMSRRAAGLF
jgi:iron(III) transport system permease protein